MISRIKLSWSNSSWSRRDDEFELRFVCCLLTLRIIACVNSPSLTYDFWCFARFLLGIWSGIFACTSVSEGLHRSQTPASKHIPPWAHFPRTQWQLQYNNENSFRSFLHRGRFKCAIVMKKCARNARQIQYAVMCFFLELNAEEMLGEERHFVLLSARAHPTFPADFHPQ